MPARTGVQVPSLAGYVEKKLYVDLVNMSETIRGYHYMLMVEDSFSPYYWAYRIPNKEAHTVAQVLMDQHFNVSGVQDHWDLWLNASVFA